ncbi:MAG TPA: sulfurtransferase, partial [Pseudomonadales bacterium]|nr:sulfurtransferase [Pseudomonadales bacterium]
MPLPFIMEAKELQKELADTSLLLVDLCGAEKCREGHIAGAVHLDVALLMGGEKPAVGLLPSVEKLSEVLAN